MPSLRETHIRNRYPVQPNHLNPNGMLYGGLLMKWLDTVGALSAIRFAGRTCVTARVDELDFVRPLEGGETALVEAYVYDTGRTSVRVALRAWREDPTTGETELTTDSSFTFVAIDGEGTPRPVPDLDVETEESERLRVRALESE
ncbi:acyl-CoA thioesterase [Halopiger djelfimassiliensis]|uniref:acyl-CoA thioesterase n=1 Tax=Halopiger djelfimassiliensis TaxID=1293047 RepID=UPI0006778B81|nr:acyl-CoA thioesterase [Halopiger djelfimassiliensis]